jgi:nucleoside phosphorylase
VTVGLICAIPEELTHLRANLDGVATVTVGHAEFATGTLDGHDVVLVGSGMGKVNAALVTTLLIDRFDCRSIAFSGIAGGLDPALSVGDVVIADRIVQCDAGMIHDERLEVYQAAMSGSSTRPIDSATPSMPRWRPGCAIVWRTSNCRSSIGPPGARTGRRTWCTGRS